MVRGVSRHDLFHRENAPKKMIDPAIPDGYRLLANDEWQVAGDLLAFSQILGGLLASGHYSRPPDDEFDFPGLIRQDHGKDWRDYRSDDPAIYCRHVPSAFMDAADLFVAAKDYCNNPKGKE